MTAEQSKHSQYGVVFRATTSVKLGRAICGGLMVGAGVALISIVSIGIVGKLGKMSLRQVDNLTRAFDAVTLVATGFGAASGWFNKPIETAKVMAQSSMDEADNFSNKVDKQRSTKASKMLG